MYTWVGRAVLSLHYSQYLFPLVNHSGFIPKDLAVAISSGSQQEQMPVTLLEGRGEGHPVPCPLSCLGPAPPGVSIFISAPGTEKKKQGLCVSFCSCTITLPRRSSCGMGFYLRFNVRGIVYCIIFYVMTVIFTINCFFNFMVFRSQKVPKETKKDENPLIFLTATI